MKFLVQETKESDTERFLVLEQLNLCSYQHEYKLIEFKDLANITEKGWIPIGSIDFVTEYLKNAYDFIHQNPIEVPKYLRTWEFLKRGYKIVRHNDIPKVGKYFVKDVSELKRFSVCANLEYYGLFELFGYKPTHKYDSTVVLDKTHLFAVSDVFPFVAEYRVYVIGGVIENILCYNGDCTILPDINLIKKAVELVNRNEKYLRSYTIDVMVNKRGDTAIIELHVFTSIGLYSTIWGNSLLQGYIDGIDYLLNDNKPIDI